MHEHETGPAMGDDPAHRRVAVQRRHVVDDGRSVVERGLCNRRLGRVDGNQAVRCAGQQAVDHGQDPPPLLSLADGVRARPGGLAADVEDRRAVG